MKLILFISILSMTVEVNLAEMSTNGSNSNDYKTDIISHINDKLKQLHEDVIIKNNSRITSFGINLQKNYPSAAELVNYDSTVVAIKFQIEQIQNSKDLKYIGNELARLINDTIEKVEKIIPEEINHGIRSIKVDTYEAIISIKNLNKKLIARAINEKNTFKSNKNQCKKSYYDDYINFLRNGLIPKDPVTLQELDLGASKATEVLKNLEALTNKLVIQYIAEPFFKMMIQFLN